MTTAGQPEASPEAEPSVAGGTAADAASGGDAVTPAPSTASSLWTEGPSGWPGVSWAELIILVVVLATVVLAIVLFVRWRKRKGTAAERPSGPSIGQRLGSVWGPFYARMPQRARHYPTFVVMGDAGAGKSHLIASRVDWRGQANQFNPSAHHDPLLQLYLGGDAVVHELSATLLRDVSRAAKRALTGLWKGVGPSVTVLVVLDARAVATSHPDDLATLAQLVRGKIGLLPRRVAHAIDVRVCLTHLDQLDGYEVFASVMGTHDKGLELDRLGLDYKDAKRLVAELDEHLAYALTTRTGQEFARLVRFYGSFEAVVGRLHPLLSSLRGDQEWGGAKYPASALYLGSIIPHSYVGDPFTADVGLVIDSIERYNRGTRLGATALAVGCLTVLGGMALWHLRRVERAEGAVAMHATGQDDERSASEAERRAAEAAADAIGRMVDSDVLWLRWVQIDRKRKISDDFERTIREHYLLPWLEDKDRVKLLYAVSLIYGTNDAGPGDTDGYDRLGRHIRENVRWWANELELSEHIVKYYIGSSHRVYDRGVVLPDEIDHHKGREWLGYTKRLCAALGREDGTLSTDELGSLYEKPPLRSPTEYEVLEETRTLMLQEPYLEARFAAILLPFDATQASEDPAQLISVAEALDELEPPARSCEGCGLGSLIDELDAIDQWRLSQQHVSEVVDELCEAPPGTAVAMVARTQAHELIDRMLEAIPPDREQDGRSFFDEDERPLAVGAIRGYGAGGVTATIDGHYTKAAFEDHVVPVLRHAAQSLPKRELTDADRQRVRSHIKRAVESYARAYHDELVTYYHGFDFNPGSKVALPFAVKALTQPSSWFTSFLTTFTTNAALPLVDDEYHRPLQDALQEFQPLLTLLAADKGAMPGLDPYTAILTELLPLMQGNGRQTPAEDGLEPRLSGLGQLALHTLQGVEVDRRAQVTEWLEGAQIDYEWHGPFDAAVDMVHRHGLQNLEDELEEAWESDVRPVVRPLLGTYPFDATAVEDAQPDEIEALLRQQGPEPGALWVQFDLLIGPATQTRGGRRVLLDGVSAPMGMLDMIDDLQGLSAALWDANGKRIPLKLAIEPQALPTKEHEGRIASMAYLSAGGSAVYAFNQRPGPQALALRWWEQGASIVSLTMTAADDEDDTKEHSLEEASSAFSFYRLLDRAWACAGKGCEKRHEALTKAAIAKGTRCGRTTSRRTTGLTARWSVPLDALGREHRVLRFVLRSDPWAPFAVRDCR